MSAPLLELKNVSKTFGNVSALDSVSLAVNAGSVTCLLGDNGAGKSTVVRILSGVDRPTSGQLIVDGAVVTLDSPRAALARGIATVYQDLALIPLLSIWRNFFLGREQTRGSGPLRRLDVRACREIAHNRLAELGVSVRDVDQPVGTLSGGERQAIAIARAIHFGARAVILDEPTAALGVKQAAHVLEYVAHAAENGITVVLITHNPQHAIAVGDRFVVLRRGQVAASFERGGVDVEQLGREMAGS